MSKKKSRRIPEPHQIKHLDSENEKFHCENCDAKYLRNVLTTLRQYSTWRVEQFIEQDHQVHRHVIDFPSTSEPNGFQGIPNSDSEQFGYYDGWEIGLFAEPTWSLRRVHGALIDDTFFVIWLDPNHRLFSIDG